MTFEEYKAKYGWEESYAMWLKYGEYIPYKSPNRTPRGKKASVTRVIDFNSLALALSTKGV